MQLAKWLSAEQFTGMGEVFRYHLDSYQEYKQFVWGFYEQRMRLGAAAPRDGEISLTADEFQARVAEAVTALREEQKARGTLSWEFMARVYVIDNKPVIQQLASALQQCDGGAQAIDAAITPILLSLVASEAVPYPADPVIFASAALVLAARRSAPRRAAADRKKRRLTG